MAQMALRLVRSSSATSRGVSNRGNACWFTYSLHLPEFQFGTTAGALTARRPERLALAQPELAILVLDFGLGLVARFRDPTCRPPLAVSRRVPC